jgi:uncharacterized protein YbgA (DUF1722 family)
LRYRRFFFFGTPRSWRPLWYPLRYWPISPAWSRSGIIGLVFRDWRQGGRGEDGFHHSPRPDAGAPRGAGLFGEEVLARFPTHPVEDEGRLKSFAIREHFLISLYLLAELRLLARAGELSIQRLIDFHTRHKLLLMAYSQSQMRAMGRALAAYHKKNLPEVTRLYDEGLRQALAKPLSYTAMINALQHAFGGLTGDLTAEERRFFLNALEEYRDERVPLAVPLRLLEAWALRQGNGYLLSQSLLSPYPRGLVEITDSGKGRDL